jgi:hypothetical protein
VHVRNVSAAAVARANLGALGEAGFPVRFELEAGGTGNGAAERQGLGCREFARVDASDAASTGGECWAATRDTITAQGARSR